jgi:uncharacterized protein YecE (DUF72 family)
MRIGCSGWQYRHWRGEFYPVTLAQARWLEYYAERFNTVEINNTFYRLPEAATFTKWGRVAHNFVYAVKASRFLTHMKKLKDPEEPVGRFFSRARHLGPSFGPVLFQLPPHWAVNLERLKIFLSALPPHPLYAIEFRDPSWYTDEIFAVLEAHGVALCVHDMTGSASGKIAVGPFTYIRFHGVQRYSGRYPDETLDSWAAWLAERVLAGAPLYAYFQ